MAEDIEVTPPPPSWLKAMEGALRQFTVPEQRAQLAEVLEERAMPLAIFGRWEATPDGHNGTVYIRAEAAFGTVMPHHMWSVLDPNTILDHASTLVGKTRGDGHDHLVPHCDDEDFHLLGVALAVAEVAVEHQGLDDPPTAYTLYAVDKAYTFYVCRVMPDGSVNYDFKWMNPALSDEEYAELTQDDMVSSAHLHLARLLIACMATPEECRVHFGKNDIAERLGGFISNVLTPSIDPSNPARTN